MLCSAGSMSGASSCGCALSEMQESLSEAPSTDHFDTPFIAKLTAPITSDVGPCAAETELLATHRSGATDVTIA